MSTYYYIVCDTHKEYCGAVGVSVGKIQQHYSDIKAFHNFLLKHVGCDVKITSEHDFFDIIDDYTNIEDPDVV